MKKYKVFGYIMSCNTKLPLPEYGGAKEAELEMWLEPNEQAVPAEYCLKSEFQIEGNGLMDKCFALWHRKIGFCAIIEMRIICNWPFFICFPTLSAPGYARKVGMCFMRPH